MRTPDQDGILWPCPIRPHGPWPSDSKPSRATGRQATCSTASRCALDSPPNNTKTATGCSGGAAPCKPAAPAKSSITQPDGSRRGCGSWQPPRKCSVGSRPQSALARAGTTVAPLSPASTAAQLADRIRRRLGHFPINERWLFARTSNASNCQQPSSALGPRLGCVWERPQAPGSDCKNVS